MTFEEIIDHARNYPDESVKYRREYWDSDVYLVYSEVFALKLKLVMSGEFIIVQPDQKPTIYVFNAEDMLDAEDWDIIHD
jgi:hypothetical protein